MYTIILCGDFREGTAYAREQGFPRGSFRVAARAASIKGLRVGEVHELASFGRRRDRHAFLAVLRYAKIVAWFLIDDGWNWPAPRPEPEQLELPFDTSATVVSTGSGPTPAVNVVVPAAEVEPKADSSEVLPPKPVSQRTKGRRRPPARPPEPVEEPPRDVDLSGPSSIVGF